MAGGEPGLESAMREVVIFCGYAADRSGARPHDDTLRRHALLAAVDAFKQRAVSNSRGGKDAVACGHFLERIDTVEIVDAPSPGASDLVIVAKQQLALHVTSDAAERCRRKDAL